MFQLQSIKHIELDQPYCNSPTLLKSISLSHIEKLTVYVRFIPHININSPNIKSLTTTCSYFYRRPGDNIQNILLPLQDLYIKNNNDNNQIIDISRGDAVIDKYIKPLHSSNLQHINFEGETNYISFQADNTILPHPIFWLWNIPNLKTCQLNITLPPAKISEQEFQKLLSISTVIQTARNQKHFNRLILQITTECGCYNMNGLLRRCGRTTHRQKKDNSQQLFTKDLNTFLTYISKLYPNLKSIKYNVRTWSVKYENFTLSLDWNNTFKNIQYLDVNCLSLEDADDILLFIYDNKCISTCYLGIKMKRLNMFGSMWWENDNSLMCFMNSLCFLMNKPPEKLQSFVVVFDSSRGSHRDLTETYWNLYEKLLQTIVNNDNIFDGYLQFKLPWIAYFLQKINPTTHGVGTHEWNDQNKVYSKNIARFEVSLAFLEHHFELSVFCHFCLLTCLQ
eukprot:151096_1